MTAPTAGPAISPVRSIATGTAGKYALLGVNIAIVVVLLPFTMRHLGAAGNRLWMLVAMTYYFQRLDMAYVRARYPDHLRRLAASCVPGQPKARRVRPPGART